MNDYLIDTEGEDPHHDPSKAITVMKEVEDFLGEQYFTEACDWDWSDWPLLGLADSDGKMVVAGHNRDAIGERTVITIKEMRSLVLEKRAIIIEVQKCLTGVEKYDEGLL